MCVCGFKRESISISFSILAHQFSIKWSFISLFQYHSLPLHVAIKARLEHQEALKQLEFPTWKRKLMEFG